ncbi:MAG: asparagine synthase-related protein [Pyrobaculum sp.]
MKPQCDAVLLSGGIDSTYVLWKAVEAGARPHAFTVELRGCGVDLPYAMYTARRFSVPLTILSVGLDEALRAAEEVVAVLQVFNPMEVVNCAAVYIAIKEAASWGHRVVCTGDGGDELYLGYSFYLKYLDRLEEKRREVLSNWSFCSFAIGRSLGVAIEAPFTSPEAVQAALAVPAHAALGKRPLREALKQIAPEVAQREKTPLESGTCFNRLYTAMRKAAGDELTYLKQVYQRLGLSYITSPDGCPRCGYAGFKKYCPMCGYYRE